MGARRHFATRGRILGAKILPATSPGLDYDFSHARNAAAIIIATAAIDETTIELAGAHARA